MKQSHVGHRVAQCHNILHGSDIFHCKPVLLTCNVPRTQASDSVFIVSVFASVLRRVILRARILFIATACASGQAATQCSETSSHSSSESTLSSSMFYYAVCPVADLWGGAVCGCNLITISECARCSFNAFLSLLLCLLVSCFFLSLFPPPTSVRLDVSMYIPPMCLYFLSVSFSLSLFPLWRCSRGAPQGWAQCTDKQSTHGDPGHPSQNKQQEDVYLCPFHWPWPLLPVRGPALSIATTLPLFLSSVTVPPYKNMFLMITSHWDSPPWVPENKVFRYCFSTFMNMHSSITNIALL